VSTDAANKNYVDNAIINHIPSEIEDSTGNAIINCVGPNAIDVTLNTI
jgi:hypothetical protein